VTAWHLHGDGTLAAAPAPAGVTAFRYDPADPTPAVGGQRMTGRTAGRKRNNQLEARADVRVFTSAPLAAPLEVAGPVSARLTVSASAACFDVFARLCDVEPGGASFNVCDGLVRVTGGTGEVTVAMSSAAYRFGAGHRLRLQVSGGAWPRFARSSGTAEPPGRAERMVPADIEIRHGPGSALLLPVSPAGALPS
jgi:putative CocE/NonD family hydrolase